MAFIHINNKSDFQLLLKARAGKTFPDCAFTLVFQTAGEFCYKVKSDDTARFVPNEARTEAVVTFDFRDGNYFPNGQLLCTIMADMPNGMFPDGYENTQTPMLLNIVIWDGASDYAEAVAVDFVLPYVSVESTNTQPVLDTSNVIGKRITENANPYQLYDTCYVRLANPLANDGKFADTVPQWVVDFCNRYFVLFFDDGTYYRDSIPILYISDVVLEQVGLLNFDEDAKKYKNEIVFDGDLHKERYDLRYMFIQINSGIYYFDGERNLRRYGNSLPIVPHITTDYRVSDLLNFGISRVNGFYRIRPKGALHVSLPDQVQVQFYVRRRDNFHDEKWKYSTKRRYYYYWRKMRNIRGILRSLNNKPLKVDNTQFLNKCLMRIRWKSRSRRGAMTEWQYYSILITYTGHDNDIKIKRVYNK